MKVKIKSFKQFYSEMRELEERYNLKLFLKPGDFNIYKVKSMENPIKKDMIVDIKIVLLGRFQRNIELKEMLGIAYNRIIHVINCNFNIGEIKKVKIFRNKHGINYGEPI